MPSSLKIIIFCIKNILKNLLMLLFPGLITRFRRPTGTGNREIDSDLMASVGYSKSVFEKYLRFLDVKDPDCFLNGKTVIEMGPGDSLTVAFLFLAHGAQQVICIDRFPLIQNIKKIALLFEIVLQNLPEHNRERLNKIISFNVEGELVWDNSRLMYCCTKKTIIPLKDEKVDLVVSNAVLEHVPDLDGMFCETRRIMKPQALMVHAADLGPHQLSINNPLDFLLIPDWLWKLMTFYRGSPNRARKSLYERLLKKHSFDILRMETTEHFDRKYIDEILINRPQLSKAISHEDLACRSILFSAKKG